MSNFSIGIDRSGKNVRLSFDVNPERDVKTTYYLYWECSNEVCASLLANHMQDRLDDHMRRVRQAAYEKGWQDAKAKKAKRTYFDWALWVIEWWK
jgi:hypothetical protein